MRHAATGRAVNDKEAVPDKIATCSENVKRAEAEPDKIEQTMFDPHVSP